MRKMIMVTMIAVSTENNHAEVEGFQEISSTIIMVVDTLTSDRDIVIISPVANGSKIMLRAMSAFLVRSSESLTMT